MKEFEKVKRQKQIIQELRKQGLTLRLIAKKTGLTFQRIHQVLQEESLNVSEFTLSKRLKENFNIQEILKRGWPDFLVITKDGKICAIEVKAKGDKLSTFQKKMCLYLEAAGIPVFVSANGELNKDIIDFFKNGKREINDKILKIVKESIPVSQKKTLIKQRNLTIIRAKVLKLYKEKNPDMLPKDIAEAFKMSEGTIYNILKNPIPLPYNKGTIMEKLYN